ncbi:MAG: DNA double-strand break repair nuclease NurA [Euryarchaeota archaeon]|nr:DNA double-strand break repair nuclease NurA [Euryarchaeota archaeon]
MTLDPVHIKAISDLASRIEFSIQDEDTESSSEFLELLRELWYDGNLVLRSLGRVYRSKVDVERMSRAQDPIPRTFSCDGGSTNPFTFDNGLSVDFCHSALASTPTDLEIHSKRTIVAATYSPSSSVIIDTTDGWDDFDDGSGRSKIVRIQPGLLQTRISRLVHNIALYLAESEHILWMMDRFTEDSLLIMDGPIYPKQLMYWMVVESDEVQIRYDPYARQILQNYIDIMDHHLENRIPLIGFVKNPEDMQIIRTLRKRDDMGDIPWLMDAQFFKSILKPRHSEKNRYITYTNWFMQPNQFYESMMATTSPLMEERLTHRFPKEDYSLTFFMVHVPSMNVMFKIESPYGLTRDEDMRETITRKVLYDIAINGIPETLSKADTLAKVRLVERRQIIDQFKELTMDTKYNDIRWSEFEDE